MNFFLRGTICRGGSYHHPRPKNVFLGTDDAITRLWKYGHFQRRVMVSSAPKNKFLEAANGVTRV